MANAAEIVPRKPALCGIVDFTDDLSNCGDPPAIGCDFIGVGGWPPSINVDEQCLPSVMGSAHPDSQQASSAPPEESQQPEGEDASTGGP